MSFLFYISSALWVMIVSLFPIGGMYVAIPMGLLLGMDYVSVFLFATIGAYAPMVLVSYFYALLIKFEWFQKLHTQLLTDKVKTWMSRWGRWIVLISLPFFNGWIVGLFARWAGLRRKDYLPLSFIVIAVLAFFQLFLIYWGQVTARAWVL